MSHDISHNFSACFVIFSSVISLNSIPSGEMLNLLPHSKPCAWYYFHEKMQGLKEKESVACKQNKTPLYFQLHTQRHVRRFNREQMASMLSFWRFFNLKVWFLWLFINPYPVYLQTKEFSYQHGGHIPFWMV